MFSAAISDDLFFPDERSNAVATKFQMERAAKFKELLGRLNSSIPQERWERLAQIQKNMEVFRRGFSTLIEENDPTKHHVFAHETICQSGQADEVN